MGALLFVIVFGLPLLILFADMLINTFSTKSGKEKWNNGLDSLIGSNFMGRKL